MALRREDLESRRIGSAEGSRSVMARARESLSDPEFRAYLEASIERVRLSDAEPISADQFLARPSHRLGSAAPRRQRVPRLDRPGVSELIGAASPERS